MPRGFRIGHTRAHRVSGDLGTYSVTGFDAVLKRGLRLPAENGTYTITGQPADFISRDLTPIQVNLANADYFDTTPVFVDGLTQGFGLMVKGTTTPTAVNPTDGWPTGDFEAVSQLFPALTASGTWTVEFEVGVGTVSYNIRSAQTGDTLTVGAWDSVTKKQVVTYNMTAGRPKATCCIQLTGARRIDGVSGGVTGIRTARPGYTIADLATKTFTDEFLASIAKLRILRFMDWQFINGTQNFGQGQDFSKRPTPTNRRTTYSYGEDPTGATAKRIGHALETICALSNQTGKDIWIHFPVFATNTYIAQVISLVHSLLTGGQKVYLEWVNEIGWNFNGGFEQYDVLQALVATELNGYVDVSARTSGQNTRYITSATRAGDVVTIGVSVAHSYTVGSTVRFANIDGVSATTTVTVTAVPGPTLFSFVRAGGATVAISSGSFVYDAATTSNLVTTSGASQSLLDARPIYVIRRAKEIGDLCRSVVGDANMRTRYIPVYAFQSAGTEFDRELRWLKAAYPAQDPGYYIMACAHAPYFGLDGTTVGLPLNLASSTSTTTTVADYVTYLNATAKYAKKAYGYEEKAATCIHYSTATNPIELLCYEGGPDTSTLGGSLANGHANNVKKSQAQIDPGFQPAMAEFYRDCMRYGTNGSIASQYWHGEGDPSSSLQVDRWWTSDAIGNTGRPKIAAMFQVANETRPQQPRLRGLGTFDARLRAGFYTDIDPNLTVTGTYPWLITGDINFNTQSITYLWDETATVPTARTIAIDYTNRFDSPWTAHVDINGTRVATGVTLIATTTDPNPPTTVKTLGPYVFVSRPGKNSIRIVRAGGGSGRDGQIRSFTIASAVEPSWVGTVPNVSFTQGTSSSYALTQHTTLFDPALHKFEVLSGTLPTGVTLNDTTGYVYNGTSPTATASNIVIRIADRVTSAESDYAARVAELGTDLIRTFSFNSAADLGGGFGANFGNLPQGSAPAPVIDTLVKASGNSSMRFDVPAALGGAMWWTNLSSDLSKLYGAGEQVNFQFRYRVSPEIAADYAAKIFLFGTGDTPGVFQSSCTDLEIELNAQIFGQKFLMAYNACPGACGANSVFTFQQAMVGGQRFLSANEWMTIQCQATFGPLETHGGHDWFVGSNVKIWIQYGLGPEILVFDWTGGPGGTPGSTPTSSPPCWGLCAGHTVGGGQKYGKLWLLPYNQELDAGAQPGKIWYDDLIIAKRKIRAVQA